MKDFRLIISLLLAAIFAASPASAAETRITFEKGKPGSEAGSFVALVGNWHIDVDGRQRVYAVDGRNWEQGLMAPAAAKKARTFFGTQGDQLFKTAEAYRYFPLAICKEVKSFQAGSIEVTFKPVSGKIDQAAGIAFDIKPNGHYLVVRANPLENNLVLFNMEGGRRTTVQWIRNVATTTGQWHTLRVTVNGKRIEGYLDNRKYIDHPWSGDIDGKIGLWSKADSYVFFGNLFVKDR